MGVQPKKTTSLESKSGGLLKSTDRANFFQSLQRQEDIKKATKSTPVESDLLGQVYIYHVDDDDDMFDDDDDDNDDDGDDDADRDDGEATVTSTDGLSTDSSTSDGEPRLGSLPPVSTFSISSPPKRMVVAPSLTSQSSSSLGPSLNHEEEERFLKNIGWNEDDTTDFDGWLTEEEIEKTRQELGDTVGSSDQLKKPSSCPSLSSFRSNAEKKANESDSSVMIGAGIDNEFVPDNWEDLRFHGGDDSFLESESETDDWMNE